MIAGKLDELGLSSDTILIFTGDNGGEDRVTSNAPLRAGKSTLYEGGIRVPLIVRYPNVVPAGTVCKTPTSNIDFYPTLCQLAGIRPNSKQHIGGVSILPLLKNPNYQLKRQAFYWHYPLDKPHFLGGRSSGAVRQGDWKLIEYFDTGEKELYNLADDISEKNNLANTNPEKVAELHGLLKAWRKEVGAKIPEGQSG
jgi:arylsulfatase A